MAEELIRVRLPRGKSLVKKGRNPSVASIPRCVGEIAKKRHLPSVSARSSKKGKEG